MTNLPAPPLYMLAFDHRQVLRDLFGKPGEHQDEQHARFADAKALAIEALLTATTHHHIPLEHIAFLVDEEYGSGVAQRARTEGIALAMPLEASRTPLLELEYGTPSGPNLAQYRPDMVKVLLFHNPADSADRQQRQISTLRSAYSWAKRHQYPLMVEVLIRPTADQLAHTNQTFRSDYLPRLICQTIRQFQEAGIEPAMWKLEGLERSEDVHTVAEHARRDGRSHVSCVVLGGGADLSQAQRWVTTAAGCDGFSGFAVGRSVWHEPLTGYYAGHATRSATVASIAERFAHIADAFAHTRQR